MSLNYLELTETEEDYTGINRANLITAEIHQFTTADSRVFAPDLGQFYINKTFQINDAISGRKLVRGEDFDVEYYSKRVFEKSGQDNGYLILVKNIAISGVLLTYQCVGGLYTSPAYLIQMMMEKYPDGIGPVIYWKNVLFKPDQYVPAGHRHFSSAIYGMSPHNDALERVRGGMTNQDRLKFGDFYDNTLARYNELMSLVNNGYNSNLSLFQETRKGLEFQQGDFVYTDSNADQAVLRKYGKWKRHTGTMLAAGGPTNAGTSMSVGAGVVNPIRQTNLYQRIDDPWEVNPELQEMSLLLQPSKMSFNEGETITISLVGVNIPPMTQVTGQFVGIAADNVVGGNLTWQATLDAFGKATITLQTVENGRTTGNVNITILPNQFATAAITVLMVDTSRTATYTLNFSADAQGLNLITRVNEGSVMYMNILVTNPKVNQELTLNYAAGSATQADFVTPLPASVVIPSNGIVRIRLELLNDEKAEGEEVFVAALLPLGTADLNRSLARGEIIVVDSSYQAEFDARFSSDTGGVNRIVEANEGDTFYLYATTSLPNGTVVNLTYGGTMQLDDYDKRPTTAIVAGGLVVAAISAKNDARNDGDKILGLTVKRTDGVVLANLSIIIRDTSQAPVTTIYFTNTNGGSNVVTEFNEGDTIFITIDTKNVENGTYLDLTYAMDGAATQQEINLEFTSPLPTRVPITNNRAIIAASIKEDFKTEGNRQFRCTVVMSGVSASCLIRDTSVPIANAKFSNASSGAGTITEANEGQTVYLVVETKGYAAGAVLNLTYTGSATDADFVAPRPTSVIVTASGLNIVAMSIKNDYASEGIEVMTVNVRSGAVSVANTTLTIRDTSLTPELGILLSLSSTAQTAITNINEGITAYVHVNWTNLPVNSTMTWSVVHITTSNADFNKNSGNLVNGSTITGSGVDSITTVLDKLTEGTETFRLEVKVTLPDARVITSQTDIITLNDTSLTEVFTVSYSSDALGNTTVTSANEGTAVYLIVRSSNIPNGTTFRLNLPNTGAGFANDDDVEPTISNSTFTITNNFASRRINILADRVTEGNETLLIRTTRVDANISVDASLIIVDTSSTVNVTCSLRLANGNKPTNNNFNEGQTGYLLVSWTNGTIGDRIRPTLTAGAGNAVASDFNSSSFGEEHVISTDTGTMQFGFDIKNDRITDGDKLFAVTITNLTTVSTYPLDGVYRILDTSKATTYTDVGFATTATTFTPITTINEGSSCVVRMRPIDAVAGDVFRMTVTGGTATLNTDYTVSTANEQTWNESRSYLSWGFSIAEDRTTEGNESIIVQLFNVTMNQVIGTYQVTIIDTSLTPTAAKGFYNAPVSSGNAQLITSTNEGQTIFFRLSLVNQVWRDEWRISIAGNSQANSADVDGFTTSTLLVPSTNNSVLQQQLNITADDLTEGPENLILQIEFKRFGETTWRNEGTATILINDTSKTAGFDIYYSTNSGGTNRITSIGEGQTIYLIASTTNVAAGTILQVNFAGSDVNSADFTTAPPYAFPSNINTLVPMTVQSNGIAFYRFDIKADLVEG